MKIEIEVPGELLTDLLTTAVEGGINYWAAVTEVQRDEDSNVVSCRVQPEDDTQYFLVDRIDVETGVRRIMEGNLVRSDIRQALLLAMVDEDSTSWDAETADCVMQAALFNEIVYG